MAVGRENVPDCVLVRVRKHWTDFKSVLLGVCWIGVAVVRSDKMLCYLVFRSTTSWRGWTKFGDIVCTRSQSYSPLACTSFAAMNSGLVDSAAACSRVTM
jgi:hypothetical protein